MLESLFNKVEGHWYFPVKFAKLLRTPFLQNSSCGCLWVFTRVFNEVWKKKPVRLSAINTRFGWKKFAARKIQKQTSKVFSKRSPESLIKTGFSTVFACECCEIFKNIYFEKHLWTAASENEHNSVTNLPKGGNSWIPSSF